MNIPEKFTNSEMEEMCRAKGEWRCVEPPCVREHSALTSRTCAHQPGNSLNFNIFTFFEVSRNRLIDWIIGHWSLASGDWSQSQCPFLSPEVQKEKNLYSSHWVLSVEYWVLGTSLLYGSWGVPWKPSRDLWRKVNFKSFRRPGPWNRIRIKCG